MTEDGGIPGTVYLIHFDTPLKHARHYVGWASDLELRLERHRSGNGSALMRAVKDEGITWRLARQWAGTRNDERRLKKQRNTPRQCPICQGWVAKKDPNPWADGTFAETL